MKKHFKIKDEFSKMDSKRKPKNIKAKRLNKLRPEEKFNKRNFHHLTEEE